jgi:Helicase HerA, central domain
VADSAPETASSSGMEKPACFYLGQEYDLATKTVLPGTEHWIEYDARNLTTHGVIVGMTGSGKTGLSIALLEEVAIDAIPAVIIDPKGDLTNLLLQFPDLNPDSFARWLNPDEARVKHLTVPAYAEQLAQRWREGLKDSEQSVERIKYVKQGVDHRIYTPGSEAGLSLSILRTFSAPKTPMLPEDLTQKINATATALLGLSGIAADPVQSREHILIAQLLQNAWSAGRDLDLAGLIKEIQNPPLRTVGAYNLETFFPAKDRVKFASQLNNVLASPVFATWTTGEPLDLATMLYRNGKPQHLIFYLAHLDDSQRMFFTTLLLEEVLGWTRRQTGTTNLRMLLYFDEVFGYLPPHPGNPPSKGPLLTLLKQGRGFGVGVLLATQNPVDLDYKALSNAGTWFVGKLQTERDKARLLDGLDSVAAETGSTNNRAGIEKVIASLGNRIFLLHNINASAPHLFRSKWALSFLRGPLSRDQIKELMREVKERERNGAAVALLLCSHCQAELPPGIADRCPSCGQNPWTKDARVAAPAARFASPSVSVPATPSPATSATTVARQAPVLPPDVSQFYFAPRGAVPTGAEIEYCPYALGFADVVFLIDRKAGREHRQTFRRLASAPAPGYPIEWERSAPCGIDPVGTPLPGAVWAAVPESLDTGRKLKTLEKAFADFVYGNEKLALFTNRELELTSEVGESEAQFRQRCRAAAEQGRLRAIEIEQEKFRPRFRNFDTELPEDLKAQKKKPPVFDEKKQEKFDKLCADYDSKKAEISARWRQDGEAVTPVQLKPRKGDIQVTYFGIAWVPYRLVRSAKGVTRELV